MKKFNAKIKISGNFIDMPVFAKTEDIAREEATRIQQNIDYVGSTNGDNVWGRMQITEDTSWVNPPFTADSKDYTD